MSNDRKPWRQKTTREIYSNRYFQLRVDECELGNGKVMPHYFVIDFPDWVQVVARKPDGQLIVVDQYRYPGEGWFLEFPGGSTQPTRDEDPKLAAQRELLEETGYESQDWHYLGAHYPNPALLNNRCHVFVAENCKKVAEQKLDAYEVLEVKEMELSEFERIFYSSDKKHSLMLATLEMYKEYLASETRKGKF